MRCASMKQRCCNTAEWLYWNRASRWMREIRSIDRSWVAFCLRRCERRMRIVNAVPTLKNKMRDSELKLRKIKEQAVAGQQAELKV